ncbi:transcriptional regulator [Neiella marina]|uniref:Transcriptional regulator n=1 Tax=Neiella marina TaxID=508461 RepID=A0A8J2XP28_9GAMM|nr:winged helix-turn-helix domain-containing protein [Neiella marina]GGA73452.1 transcriptional regulator [Neiella marina]
MNKNQPGWTLLSNHAHVLVCLTLDPKMRLRDMASNVGITERAVQRIIAELEEAGFLSHHREGRRNHYQIHTDQPLRHPLEKDCSIGSLLEAVTSQKMQSP